MMSQKKSNLYIPPTPPSSPNLSTSLPKEVPQIFLPSQNPDETSPYHILGVHQFSTDSEIKRAYHSLSKKYHPDRSKDEDSKEKQQAIQKAYSILGDKAKRCLYDIRNNIYIGKDGRAKLQELYELRKNSAELAIKNMQFDYYINCQNNLGVNGLLIKKALYGNLRIKQRYLKNETSIDIITEEHLEGPFIDVTIPLQCQALNSQFVLDKSTGESLEFLDGFYHPAPFMEKHDMCLYVCYWFKNRLHEFTAAENSSILFPVKSHIIPDDTPKGPFAPNNSIDIDLDSSTDLPSFYKCNCNLLYFQEEINKTKYNPACISSIYNIHQKQFYSELY